MKLENFFIQIIILSYVRLDLFILLAIFFLEINWKKNVIVFIITVEITYL